ncbi:MULTISPECIES: DUF6889 family protein [Morganella]|jgi:hypothetical protein|nr:MULTISPECIES: hypothetical protein [Morganella]MDH0356863.1 hypothetical protein [Morganella sp. GD04133]
MCRYESLLDGTVSLADIALMNDFLDVEAENEATIERYKHEQR